MVLKNFYVLDVWFILINIGNESLFSVKGYLFFKIFQLFRIVGI